MPSKLWRSIFKITTFERKKISLSDTSEIDFGLITSERLKRANFYNGLKFTVITHGRHVALTFKKPSQKYAVLITF